MVASRARLSGSSEGQAKLELLRVERRGRRGISESSGVFSVHEIGAHESNEFEEAVGFSGDLLQGAQKKKGDQSDGDLDAHGVFRPSNEPGDLERLFHHAEEQLDPPATLVQIRNLLSGRVEIVGHEAQVWPVSVLTTISRTASCIGFLRFMACRAGRKPIRSLKGVDPSGSGKSRGPFNGVLVLKRVTSRQPSASSLAQKAKS